MGTFWKHPVMTVLLGDATAWVSAQQPTNALAANYTPVSPAIQTAQPSPNIVSENVFDLQKRDLTKEAQNQAARRVAQPGNSAPAWREVNSDRAHYASISGLETGVLIQRTGQKWWLSRNDVTTVWGDWLMVLVPSAILALFLWRGMILLEEAPAGRRIRCPTSAEHYVHRTMAIFFVALDISGIVMPQGEYFLLSILDHQLLGRLACSLKDLYNLVDPLSMISIVVASVIWVWGNLPHQGDAKWLLSLEDMFAGEHGAEVPSYRFNAGEELWFWGGFVAFGLILSTSGQTFDHIVPGVDYYRGTIQLAEVIHAIAAVGITSMSLGHIYMGAVGMEGAYHVTRDGYVDEVWAKEHRELWYDDAKAGRIPTQRSQPPAPPAPGEQPAKS